MVALSSMQQIQSSDSNMNTWYKIGGATALAGALAYATHTHMNQPESITIPHATTTSIQSIVFDMDGVLSTTNKLRAFYEVGLGATFWEMFDQMQLPSEKMLFDALANVPAISTKKSYTKGLQMPQIMVDWQTSAQDLTAIKKSISDYLATADMPESVKNWVTHTAIGMMLTPEKFVATRQTIPANVALLHELKDKGYKLYILSNWDKWSFPLFQQQFPEIFKDNNQETFDGIVISGDIHDLKPNEAAFTACIEKYNLEPQATLFIDDEAVNTQAAERVGIHTIVSDPSHPKELRDHVIQLLTTSKS